ncbi:MAG: diguanylate cyclase [Oscillospiraceae bacterium]
MNTLSALSIIIFTSFFIGAAHMLTAERKGILNISASTVLTSLGWWSFCNAFFFSAATQEQAFFWHRLSSIGWCSFVAFTALYFIALTNYKKGKISWWEWLLFFLPTAILILKNLLGKTTSLAQNIIMSSNGWGWTYENSVSSFWLWAYLFYVAVYFGFAFCILYKWAKSVKHVMKKEMAVWFIILDVATILCGVVTDVILPLTTPVFPAMASVATAIFGICYFTIIYRHDVFNINLIISSDDILQTSNNSIFVMDENKEILKYNNAVGALLGFNKSELIGVDFMSLAAEQIDFEQLNLGADMMNIEAKMRCKDGQIKNVLMSASAAKDKRHSFLCFIVSCQDVSKQMKTQDELEFEREKYKQLANDYQKLAYYDPLTGLPNRRLFFDTLNDFEKRFQAEKNDFAAIFLDLDNFKHANDLYGHKGGDELLKAAANKLQACADEGEFVARLGGDEFMVLIPYTEASCIERKMQRIREEFSKSFLFYDKQYEIGISAGYGVYSQIGDVNKLMQKADEAMYGAKKGLFSNTLKL